MDPTKDLEYDLRWFLYSANQFQPEPNIALSKKRNELVIRMACIIENLQNQPSDKIKSWHNDVRKKLMSLGFYKDKRKTRPDPQVLEGAGEIGPRSKQRVSTNPKKVYVYVYTSPTPPEEKREVTEKECLTPARKRSRQVDCVHCVGRHTAKKLAGEKKGDGIIIEMKQNEDIIEFWKKLDNKTYGNLIKELHIFGHGLPDNVQIGGGVLTPNSLPPIDLWCHFDKNANVVLYGCLVAARVDRPVLTEITLFDWVGNTLLCRGGTVHGSTAIVNNECGEDGLVLSIQDRKSKQYLECNVTASIGEFQKVLDEWIANNIKVK